MRAPRPIPDPEDLAVCYRICPRVSGRPLFEFGNDKPALLRLNLETFREALGALRARIWFLLDGCPPLYRDLVQSLFPDRTAECVELPGEGNQATFGRQVEILSEQDAAPLVCFAEDDYLYLPGALERGVDFLRGHPEADFATLYDHADHYRTALHRAGTRGALARDSETVWRPVASTCLTFLARRDTLREARPVFRSYARGNSDLGMWLALTRTGLFNPRTWIRSLGDGLFFPASMALAWRHAPGRILFGRRMRLFAPRPSLATHMERDGLAPGVDWSGRFEARAARFIGR